MSFNMCVVNLKLFRGDGFLGLGSLGRVIWGGGRGNLGRGQFWDRG